MLSVRCWTLDVNFSQILIKSYHYFLVSGVGSTFGDQQHIKIIITKEPKGVTTKTCSIWVVPLNDPIKTRRASQQWAETRAVLFERQRVSLLAARCEKRRAARRAAFYGRFLLVRFLSRERK